MRRPMPRLRPPGKSDRPEGLILWGQTMILAFDLRRRKQHLAARLSLVPNSYRSRALPLEKGYWQRRAE